MRRRRARLRAVRATACWLFALTAFGFGLASIFTPCVFPMIPITVSYFLNQQSAAGDSCRPSCSASASSCCSPALGLRDDGGSRTVRRRATRLQSRGSTASSRSLFFAFGLSLLGAFEITIPSGILTQAGSVRRDSGGFVGTLLMGLTFSLTSFACVGPFVGTAAGRLGVRRRKPDRRDRHGRRFATGLALPFFLLALFPSYLKKLPRSGGWMARVKVVMGFVILAAMLEIPEQHRSGAAVGTS